MNLNNFTDGKSRIIFDENDIINNEIETNNFLFNNKINMESSVNNTQYFMENLKNGKINKIHKEAAENLINKKIVKKIEKIDEINLKNYINNLKTSILKIMFYIGSFLPGMIILNGISIWIIDFSIYSNYSLRIFHLIFFCLVANLIYIFEAIKISNIHFKISKRKESDDIIIIKQIYLKNKIQFIIYIILFLISLSQRILIWEVSLNPSNGNSKNFNKFFLKISCVIEIILIIIVWGFENKEENLKLNFKETKILDEI